MANDMLNDALLWDYADGFLDPEEQARVEALLLSDPVAQRRLEHIRADKKAFAALPLDLPNAGFADRVMAAWAVEHVQSKAAEPGKDWIIRAIVGLFSLFILIPLVVMLFAAGQLSPETVTDLIPPLPVIDWSAVLGNSALLYTVYLGLAYLSLRLLEKYLQHRGILSIR